MKRIFVAAGCAAACALCATAQNFLTGYREHGEISVPAGATSNFTGTLTLSRGTLDKQGEGTLSLACSNVVATDASKIFVRQGRLDLALTDSMPAGDAERPDSLLQRAAFWVDANTNVLSFASNGTTYVTDWLDVREPSTNAPYQFIRAGSMLNRTNLLPELVITNGAVGDFPAIFFGYATSGRWMKWKNTDDTSRDISGIYHAFVVRGIFKSCGFVLGSTGWPPDFHAQSYSSISMNGTYWLQGGWELIPLYRGRTYLNGVHIDGTSTALQTGWQLQEVAFEENTAHADNFFNDRNYWSEGTKFRSGGDYLCEVVIYTNRLAETERMEVERYLVNKWRGPTASEFFEIKVCDHGILRENVPEGIATNTLFNIGGNGTFEKAGAGTLVIPDTTANPVFNGEVALSEGALNSAIPAAIKPVAGRCVVADDTTFTLADAPAKSFVKDGAGTVTICSIPDAISTLRVKQGALIMKRPVLDTDFTTNIYGSIPNPSFELDQYSSGSSIFANGETRRGWTSMDPGLKPGESYALIYNRAASIAHNSYTWVCLYYPPDGNQCLSLKWDASAYTTLTLPIGGIYDITFSTSGRAKVSPLLLDFCIADGGTTNCFATVCGFDWPWHRQRVRTPWLAAGGHTLLLRNFQQHVDGVCSFDNFKVTLVTTKKSDGTIPLKNGDFERTNYSCAITGQNYPLQFVTNNTAEGWTFSASPDGKAYIAPTRFGGAIGDYNNEAYKFYRDSPQYGNVSLAVLSNGVASTSLTLPAGTYKLQADILNWKYRVSQANGQQLEALIIRNDGTTNSLGKVSAFGAEFKTMLWASSFTIAEDETVTLALRGNAVNDSLLADNIAAVPVNAPENLVLNGGFESNSYWTYIGNTNTSMRHRFPCISSDTVNDGPARYEGNSRLRLYGSGCATQPIAFTNAGIYRLVMHVSRRYDTKQGDAFGRNPVRVWLAQGAVTNLIGWTIDDNLPFVKREFLFRVNTAGTYTFGIQGMTPETGGSEPDRTALIDGVSITEATDFADTDFTLRKNVIVTVDKGARLQLDFTCTNKVADISLGGKQVSGVIDQTRYPDYVTGPGALYTSSKGTVVMLK